MPATISPMTAGTPIRSAISAAIFAARSTTTMSTRMSVTFTTPSALATGLDRHEVHEVAAAVHGTDVDAGAHEQAAQLRHVDVEHVAARRRAFGPRPPGERLPADDRVHALEERARRGGPGSAAAPRAGCRPAARRPRSRPPPSSATPAPGGSRAGSACRSRRPATGASPRARRSSSGAGRAPRSRAGAPARRAAARVAPPPPASAQVRHPRWSNRRNQMFRVRFAVVNGAEAESDRF